MAAIIILSGIIKPSVGIMCAYLFAFAASTLPAILLWIIHIICFGLPSPELTMFLLIAFSTTLLSNHTNLIKKVLRKFSPWHAWNENDAQTEFVKIGEYVLQPGNVHFVVSLLYVVFLVLYAIQTIVKYEPLVSPSLSDAILKAFLVYVAYSTMMKRYDEQEISTEGIAKEILKMYHLEDVLISSGSPMEEEEKPSPKANDKITLEIGDKDIKSPRKKK